MAASRARRTWQEPEVRALGVLIDIVTAGEILGFGRTKARALAAAGTFPVDTIEVDGSHMVTKRELLEFLRLDPES